MSGLTLPFNLGDTVYFSRWWVDEIRSGTIKGIYVYDKGVALEVQVSPKDSVRKALSEVYFSRDEAEMALEEIRKKRANNG